MAQPVKTLQNIGVLVTRPQHQTAKLCAMIEENGGKAIRFPVMEICGIDNDPQLNQLADRISDFNIAIFISANAVNYGVKLICSRRSWPNSLKIAAVGKSSAKALDSLGLIADIFPFEHFNSEALLSLDEMHDVNGKKIIIFRGGAGRELLAETLTRRGANVKYANCYKRSVPKTNPLPLIKLWEHNELDVIVTTSNEGLQNLYDMVGEQGRNGLLNTVLLVVSERAVDLAMKLGFKLMPIVSAQASDEAIVAALVTWNSHNKVNS